MHPVPVCGLAANFLPMSRMAPPSLGGEIEGTPCLCSAPESIGVVCGETMVAHRRGYCSSENSGHILLQPALEIKGCCGNAATLHQNTHVGGLGVLVTALEGMLHLNQYQQNWINIFPPAKH